MIEPPDAVAHRRDDLGMRMAEHRAHLARGEVQHAPAVGVVEKRTLGPNRHEVDELAAIFQKVTPSALPKLDVVGDARHFHHSPPHRSQTETGSGRGLARNRYWHR